ncbi:MAG: pirin family protein [Thermoleophilia bacterium]|nr:pirin family protein [Thermoleophilia bacterium]
MGYRSIKKISTSMPALEGAGVHLKRAFGNRELPLFDPFLMLDDFRSDNPEHYRKGFPWHPHRGIETITYVLKGDVEHRDSLGNKGVITSGDVQWMTAGSGIIHQEMTRGDQAGHMEGFQLWLNLPASRKMMDPRYRDVKAAGIPTVTLPEGTEIKVISGRVGEVQGPVQDVVSEPEYLDVSLPAAAIFEHPTKPGHTVFAYVIEGSGYFDAAKQKPAANEDLVLFEDGDKIVVTAGDEPVRFLLLSGRPIGEPVAWRGPVVMNTQEELREAFRDYDQGTFIRHEAA